MTLLTRCTQAITLKSILLFPALPHRLLRTAMMALALLLPVGETLAAACTLDNSPAPFIRNDVTNSAATSVSYCELCGYGYVTFIVSNPFQSASLTNVRVVVDLGSSGLVYEPTAPTPILYRVNGGGSTVGTAPSGAGSVLTFNLPNVAPVNGNSAGTLAVTFAVRRTGGTPESLVSVSRNFSSTLTFTPSPSDASCNASYTATDADVLPLREPLPQIDKRGWNYDAGQRESSRTSSVYGNNNDDIVWSVRINNSGRANLQDLRFDDLMQSGSMVVNYACPTQASADAVAANNGVLPGGSPCVASSNNINDFIVTAPFGAATTVAYPWGGSYEVDVPANSSRAVYLVGKITANGSCIDSRTNRVSDVQWGCQVQAPAGGITTTSTGSTPTDTAVLVTHYGNGVNGGSSNAQLTVNRQLTGTNTAQPVGTKGTMTITLTNLSGGTVKFGDALRDLKDVLPPEYVMDPTFTPTVVMNAPYGSYRGMVDRITWTNPVPGTFPLTTTDPTVPLGNTAPEFNLYSSTVHPIYADQRDMMRHGDVLTITFRVVLIKSAFYDRVANLDVSPEANTAAAQFTDPAYQTPLANTLTVDFDTFCATDGHKTFTLTGNGTGNPTGSAIPANPEDIDVAIGGTTFILTNDPTQQLTLPVRLTNNGGHDARDYHLFVTFGTTMQVVSAPADCVLAKPPSGSKAFPDAWQPTPLQVWVKEQGAGSIPIPSTATVYECTSPTVIAPGQTVNYDFNVIKTSDTARILVDDLTFRADVIGEITLSNPPGTPLWFPAPIQRPDGLTDRANNYSLDTVWARVIGFNLIKTRVGSCNENDPAIFDTVAGKPVERVEIGEECTYHIDTGGWFGFETPGFAYIAVQNIDVVDQSPNGQAYISSTDPYAASTPLIKNVTLNPAGLAPVTEGWFDWRFNVADADRIEIADEWFRVNVTTRMLNDALNARAAPNVHGANSHNILNSTFDATFQNNNTGATEQYNLGPATVGYPWEPIRRRDLTVTEPLLTVVKEVCNETLYGVGAACSNWTTLASDGDTYDSYIYRIRVTNEAESGSLARSPAYDVVVTDTLDASDLMLVVPFNADGLDNDADSPVDGADGDGEGAIADNTVLNGTPAVITFSHTHSTALQRINPGATVTLYYRVDPDQRIAPQQILTNTVTASYDTLAGSTNESGNQTVDLRPNGDIGGARVYTSAPAAARVQIIPLLTYPKEITRLSNTPLTGVGSTQVVLVGEEIEFRLSADLPVARLRNFVIQDRLPAGMSCSQAPVVNLNLAPYDAAGFTRPDGSLVPQITPTCLSDRVVWDFGDVVLTKKPAGASVFRFPVSFIARVDNAATNNNDTVLSNGVPATSATLTYVDDGGTSRSLNYNQVDVIVKESRVAITKSFGAVVNADGGDELTITVTATNNGTADAYNLRVLDDLVDRNMTFIQGSVSGSGPPDSVDITTFGANQPVFVWAPTNPLAPGATRTFTFKVRVDVAAEPLEILDNTIQAAWTSLPGQTTALNTTGLIGADGSATGMRIGTLPNSSPASTLNDYEATASTATVSVLPVSMSKTDLTPAVLPEIGAHKQFQIEILLPEGTTKNLIAQDNLAVGNVSYVLSNNADFDVTYEFTGIASINGQAPSEAALLAFPADATSGNATWDFGEVVTATENDIPTAGPVVPRIRILYHARINNDTDTDVGDALRNGATVTYAHGETAATETLNATTAQVTAIESALTVSKAVSAVTPAPLTGGSILQYVVTVRNTGNATAYDVNLVDILPTELRLYSGFTPTATINGTPVAGFVATPAASPAGPLVWGRDNADGSLDIPVGGTLVLTYQTQVQAVTGATFNNQVWVDWTSLQGPSSYERTGAGCPTVTAPNDYCAGATSTPLSATDTTRITKSVVSDSHVPTGDATVRVGDSAIYRLELELQEGTTGSVVVTDTLPAGLVFDGIVRVNGDATAPFAAVAPFVHAPVADPSVAGSTVTWTLGDITNTPNGDGNDTFVIEYRVVVAKDTLAHQATTTLGNTVRLAYTGSDPAAARLTSSASLTVLQPIMTTPTKTETTGRVSPAQVNVATDTMQFRLESCNASGLAPAYSVTLTDTLASQLDETSITTPVVRVGGTLLTAGTDYTYTPPATRGGSMGFVIDTPVDPGACVTVDYSIGFHTDFGANQTWTNSVTLTEYWSLALPTTTGQKYGPLGPTTFTMQNVATTIPPQKIVLSPATGEATIGEEIVYRITVPETASNAALYDVVVTDVLDDKLQFLGATEISGNGFTLTETVVSPTQVNLAIAQIPAGQQAVIELRAQVRNIPAAQEGESFTNTALYTYADAAGGTTQGGGTATSAAIRIVEPVVTVAKAVTPNTPPTAGDVLTYSVDLAATSGANLSSAFDLGLVDSLSLGLEYVAGSARVGGVASEPDVSGDGTTTAQTLTWSGIDIPEGTTVAVTYDVRVLDSVGAGQILSNSATARWTSLDGAPVHPGATVTEERNGTGTPAHNDYFATATSTPLTVADNTTLAKARLTDTWIAADANLRVGDRVDYELRLGLQEGTHQNVVLTDTLPAGMVFENVVSADFFGTAGTANPSQSGQTLTWNLGTVVNAADNNPANDFLVIVYRARVLNNDALSQTPTTQTLPNGATLDYTVGGAAAAQLTASVDVAVLQPMLAVNKSVSAAGGDTVVDAGEVVTYTVDIVNSGDAPAYDTVLVDTLPAGLRQGGVIVTGISLVGAGTSLPLLAPAYDAATGVATWNFDTGTANAYTIPAGETLRVVYRVTADAALGASLTLTNAAAATLYYSFDDEAVPANGNANEREVYGPTATATATVTTAAPGALLKANTQATAAVGAQFKYTITVPETPVSTALHDVRIVDDLAASAADLRFVSVAKVSGSGSWTPANTGSDTNLVIEDTSGGIDIPAGEQAVIEITVELLDTPANVSGLTFTNTADYTYNRIADTPASQAPGLPGTTANMTIVGPDALTLEKSGPATMRIGVPASFTLNVQNTGTARAWDVTVVDRLPNPTPGGMCDVTPTVVSAQVFAADGTTPVSAPLVAGTDFTTAFVAGTPSCTFTVTGVSAAAALDPQQRLIVTYQAQLDTDNGNSLSLTNVAGATQWFSQDTSGAGATGETRTYTRTLTDGTVAVLDHEDAHTVTTESAILQVQKSVTNVTTGQPGANARPGERLRYSVQVTNVSDVPLPDFSLLDDLGALNGAAVFVPGSLALTSVPPGADTSATNPNGGTQNAGLVDVRNLVLGAQGTLTASVTVEFEVTLAPVITSGTVVLNQAHLGAYGVTIAHSDDPAVNGADDAAVIGDEDPTRTLIASAPLLQVLKTSQDMTGDASVLMAGDTLRYTITAKNIGTENATGVALNDLIPPYTTYVANTTRLNGVAVADPSAGVSALNNGMLINAPEDTTPGAMRADASATTANVATVTFDVVINGDVLDGTLIANQGFVSGSGTASGPLLDQPSDDPATTVADDPTRDIVGNVALVDALKTVSIQVDNNSNGVVDAGDVLRYTITVSNFSAIPATGLVLSDAVPANTAYMADSVTLNGVAVGQPDGGVSPLVAGVPVNAAGSASGTIPAGASAVVTFDVQVNGAVAAGTVISNQGYVASPGLPTEPTDADGIDANGDQPTTVVVGSAQQLLITKEVFVVGGGAAQAGGQLEYVVRVTNTGTTPASDVVLTDDLGASLGAQATFVAGSATLNGSLNGVNYAGTVLTADYAAIYGDLPQGGSATLRFRVLVDGALPVGSTLANTAQVAWNTPTLTASASVSIDIGGIPGSAMLNGQVWHDADFDNAHGTTEANLAGWTVALYRNNVQLGSVTTDAGGLFRFSGLAPSATAADQYELRFSAPGATTTTAKLGLADSVFTNGMQQISGIAAVSGSNLQNLNLPIDPNGVVFDSIVRTPIAGATLTMARAGSTTALPASCFDDPVQQNQVTLASGFYKFDLNYSDASCPQGGDYVIRVTPPATGYVAGPSRLIPPVTSETTAAYPVPACPADAVTTPAGYCEAQVSASAPAAAVPASQVAHYLHLTLSNPIPGDSQLFNNHIAVDPRLDNAVTISKTSALVNVSRGQLVPYTITVNNTMAATLQDLSIVDTFPPGFKYVEGSSRVNGQAVEPVKTNRTLAWNNLQLASNTQQTIKMLFIVGSGVGEGEYVNRAQVFNTVINGAASGEATATVRVVPDPTFDCTDVIGKVFDDVNRNGYQDAGEKGLQGVRVATARGLLITTDEHGRFHITCAVVPDEDRGSNFILKVDDRTLPTGYRITTENPRVQRVTRGKMAKFNFGATIHKLVRIDVANGVFEPGTPDMRIQWQPRMELLMGELKKAPSTLRLAYMAEIEDAKLVEIRLKAMKREIERLWALHNGPYELVIETEVFWRTGAPPSRSALK